MGEVDTQRQALNVARMRLLGAEVVPVKTGSRTLKDAINAAFRDWVTNVATTNYVFGTAAGPHPFPAMSATSRRSSARRARAQVLELTGRLPDAVVACVGGGSNAIGIFDAFLDDPSVRLYGIEAAGRGVDTEEHAASIERGRPGILHGARTYVLQDEDGQTIESHSISAGLDYPGVGPSMRSSPTPAARRTCPRPTPRRWRRCASCPAPRGSSPRSSRRTPLAAVERITEELGAESTILVNLSGRGDKDMTTAGTWFGLLDEGAEG